MSKVTQPKVTLSTATEANVSIHELAPLRAALPEAGCEELSPGGATGTIALQSPAGADASGQAALHALQAMQEIAEKIAVVQEIARQTNLLALFRRL